MVHIVIVTLLAILIIEIPQKCRKFYTLTLHSNENLQLELSEINQIFCTSEYDRSQHFLIFFAQVWLVCVVMAVGLSSKLQLHTYSGPFYHMTSMTSQDKTGMLVLLR